MKLYSVKVETEVIVLANDKAGAEGAAREAIHDMGAYDLDYDISPLRYLPFGWQGGELPWVDPDLEAPERTVDEWIEAGAAPELSERMAKRKAAADVQGTGEDKP